MVFFPVSVVLPYLPCYFILFYFLMCGFISFLVIDIEFMCMLLGSDVM